MNKNHRSITKIVRLSVLLAIGVVLNYFEHILIPVPIVPGVKFGLANTIGLVVLYYFSEKEFVAIGFLRVLMTALFTGFGFGFFISLSGWFVSTLMVVIMYQFQKLSVFGLSLLSAVAHGIGQVIMVSILYESIYMLNYLPILCVSGLISGLLVGLLSSEVLKRVKLVEAHE